MKTFLFQGDSITDANRDDENEDCFGLGCGYAFLLAADFLKNKKDEFRFFNRGKSGDRITDVYARIKEDIINLKPDMMSILIGVNDVSHELTQNCGVTPEKFEKIYSMLIEEIKEALPEIKIFILESFILKGIHTEARWDEFRYEVGKMAKASENVARKFNLEFISLQDKFDSAAADGNHRYWSIDGVHPSSAGHQLIKEELEKAIIKTLDS